MPKGFPASGQRACACSRNHELVVKLAADLCSLAEIGRQVGTGKGRVKAYLLKHGLPVPPWDRRGPRNFQWKGGRTTDTDGYVLIHCPDHPHANSAGYVREHRLVMEKKLGRYLLPVEVVHHKRPGDRQNNDPENLEVYESNAGHLAKELKGKKPNWSEQGIEAMRENGRSRKGARYPDLPAETRARILAAARGPKARTKPTQPRSAGHKANLSKASVARWQEWRERRAASSPGPSETGDSASPGLPPRS